MLGLLKSAFILSVGIWIASRVADEWLAQFYDESFLFGPIADFAPAVTSLVGKWIPSVRDLFS